MDENLLKKVPVKVQRKSGFDKSYQNLLTTKVGTLTPLVCEEVIPNTTVNMKIALSAQLPPLATDTFMRCQLKTEAFFVPTRLLMFGYEDWITGNDMINDTQDASRSTILRTPTVLLKKANCGAGSLADYLGVMMPSSTAASATDTLEVSAFPFLAYHKIYEDWYRNSLIQKSIYTTKYNATINSGISAYQYGPANSPWLPPTAALGWQCDSANASKWNYVDGVAITDLRQRNFGIDYFTSATPQAQNGTAQKVSFDTSGSSGEFTIAALRAANSMQQFLERNNICGNRLVDYVRAHFGANLNDSIAQRAVLLGSAAFDVYSKGIYQQANDASASVSTNNPFSSTAAKYGSAYAEGTDFIIKGFTAMEPGYIFVITSLVPKVTYASGVRRELLHFVQQHSQSDMGDALLQNTGNQPIFSKEMNIDNAFNPLNADAVFGYTDRYAEYKTRNDELHGLLRDGESLAAFALQRTFNGLGQNINTAFLQIPTSYLDQVAAVTGDVSQYGVWIDSYIDLKESMPLARYSVPSLQDPAYEHGEDVLMDRGGKHL